LIDEVIGRADSARAGSIIAMAEHGVPDGFLDSELKQVDAIKPVTMGDREDLRDIPLVTIDPVDARDHDDAVWAAPDDDPKERMAGS
jgi:ribonuclease R